MPSENSDIVS